MLFFVFTACFRICRPPVTRIGSGSLLPSRTYYGRDPGRLDDAPPYCSPPSLFFQTEIFETATHVVGIDIEKTAECFELLVAAFEIGVGVGHYSAVQLYDSP